MSQPPVILRRATATDASLLSELGDRTFFDTFAAVNTPEDMAAYRASAFAPHIQAAELAAPLTTFLIAEVEGCPSGYAMLHRGEVPDCIVGDSPIEVVRLYVVREWLGKGVGEALMRELITVARDLGAKTMWLGVWERNQRARAFYRKWGFREVGDHIFMLGTDAQTDILMQKEID